MQSALVTNFLSHARSRPTNMLHFDRMTRIRICLHSQSLKQSQLSVQMQPIDHGWSPVIASAYTQKLRSWAWRVPFLSVLSSYLPRVVAPRIQIAVQRTVNCIAL